MSDPIPSAAGIILDDTGRVLLARRADTLRFMGGHHVFPGGRIDPKESTTGVVGASDAGHAAALRAVVREIFEETGLLCVEGSLPDSQELRRCRDALLTGDDVLGDFLVRHSLTIRAADFAPAGVWITPESSPIRFHSRYYLYRHDGRQRPELIPGEMVSLDWLTPSKARQAWRAGALRLPAPVAYTLDQLSRFGVDEALARINRVSDYAVSSPVLIEFRCGIYALPLEAPTMPPATHTNCVLVGEKELLVIDPGTPHETEQASLKARLDHLLEPDGWIKAVLLTHSHPDHVGAARFVAAEYGVPIWAHRETDRQIDFPIDRHLKPDERITVAGEPDWTLRCVHTPGHDPGHLCFLEETTRTLICGDLVADRSSIAIWPEYGGNMTHYLESLEWALEADYSMLLPSHGFIFSNPKDKIREAIRHRIEREEKIKAALKQGIAGVDALLPVVYDDVSEQLWPFAKKTLEAHLIRLGVMRPPTLDARQDVQPG